MREFKVNEYIILKLENNGTVVYVADEEFVQCKYLVFNINANQLEEYHDIQSIDQLEQEDRSREFSSQDISPEEEFLGHCSNLVRRGLNTITILAFSIGALRFLC